MFRKSLLVLAACANYSVYAAPTAERLDAGFDPAAAMLAYTEFELSGEPLAEALGLDLDALDPNAVDQPTAFDYVAGIESYEYSEEAMYALNYQSTQGPHLTNGPRNRARGGKLEQLGARFIELAGSVGFPVEEIPLNLYPISLPYAASNPTFASRVDVSVVSSDEIELLDAHGAERRIRSQVPAYRRDYASLAWSDDGVDRSLSPAAVGGILLKEVMWSQDFLGGMHLIDSDEEVEADSATLDQDGKHALGVSAVDGMNGAILTELSLEKLQILQEQLAFDGKALGAQFGPDYDPASGAIWFPHRIAIEEVRHQGVRALGKLRVSDPRASLRDTWMLLWPISEYFAFSDQRDGNNAQNPAFTAVFDGAPFAAAPKENRDADPGNDRRANDAMSMAANLSNLLFRNLDALHFNAAAGTFVDFNSDGKQQSEITTYDAAYSLVALSIFQRAQDALPVGYASADGGDVDLATVQGKRAMALLRAQADFILDKLIAKNGLAVDGFRLGEGPLAGQSLDSQFAAVRGLGVAFTSTGDDKYREAARKLYLAVDAKRFDKAIGTWAEAPGKPTEHTPWTAAAISAGLREAMLHLRNSEGESAPALELETLTERYVGWFRLVVNGGEGDGLQIAEWLGDSGENRAEGDGADLDRDGVPQVTAAGGEFGRAMVMANRVRVSP